MSNNSANSGVEERPRLLTLPRELRNLIIDDVLRSPAPPPVPSRHDPNIAPRSRFAPVCVPSTRVLNCPLARTNAQLRAETTDRASKIDISLILDILVLEDGHTQCTWLSAPVTPRTLHKVTLEIRVRIRPVSLMLVQLSEGRDYVIVVPDEIQLARDHARQQVEYKVLNSIHTAVLAILFDDGLIPTARVAKVTESGTLETYYPINSIAKLNVTVQTALDENKREMHTPPGKDYSLWYQPNIFPPAFTRELAKNLSSPLLGFAPRWIPPCDGRFELFYRPVLTNVRIISVNCDGDHTGGYVYDVGFESRRSFGRGPEHPRRLWIEEERQKLWPKITGDKEADISVPIFH